MNALIISAVLGVIMMFSGLTLKKSAVRMIAIAGVLILLVSNIMETYGMVFFKVDT